MALRNSFKSKAEVSKADYVPTYPVISISYPRSWESCDLIEQEDIYVCIYALVTQYKTSTQAGNRVNKKLRLSDVTKMQETVSIKKRLSYKLIF